MEIYLNGHLNPAAFYILGHAGSKEVDYSQELLNNVLYAAAKTQSEKVESTHFLIALGHIKDGNTQRDLRRLGLTPEQWETGLSTCVDGNSNNLPPAMLSQASLHQNALEMLEEAKSICEKIEKARINEDVLLLCALRHATKSVQELCESADIDIQDWLKKIEGEVWPPPEIIIWREDGSIIWEVISPAAKKVLELMRSEAEALGHSLIDPRHLLLALTLREGQSTQYGLHHQGINPRKVQEAVTLSLKARTKQTRSSIPLIVNNLQPILRQILARAAEKAAKQRATKIAEPHLLRGFLETESIARQILEDEGANLAGLLEIAETYQVGEEEEETDTIADIDTVRARLKARLVGQDDAIERVLPYVQRMKFGFTIPGKPIGVFLFCGQSGSGKTEMAKELARGVYGSEENLIFLEMGQFNSPESMNIFVGAPPGYIGYGEGKLTNGLRDKPRAVVLFDEVEKAHPRVLDALLRVLDEGKINDPAGPVRDGSQCILILTSNVGAKELSQLWQEVEGNPNWRSVIRIRLREEFEKHNFRIEFLNRVDELILFRTLSEENYAEIARRMMAYHLERLKKEKLITVTPDPGVAPAIGEYCKAVNEGARPVLRLVQSMVITPVVDFVLRGGYSLPIKVKVSALLVGEGCEPLSKIELD